MGKARKVIVLLLAVCYFLPKPECLTAMVWPAHIVHHFFHANVFHFAVNAVALWAVLDERMKPPRWLIPTAFIIGSLSYCFAIKPVIGFSNILYAMMGLRTPYLRSAWWKQPSVLVFLAVMLIMVFIPQFSATTHIASFVMGVIVAAIIRFSKALDNDTRRAAGSK